MHASTGLHVRVATSPRREIGRVRYGPDILDILFTPRSASVYEGRGRYARIWERFLNRPSVQRKPFWTSLVYIHTIGHSSKRPSTNRNMVVVPASTTAKTTLRLPDLRAKNGLTGFAKRSGVWFLFHTLCTRDHILIIWPAVGAVEDAKGTVANKPSSSHKVGSGVIRALPKGIRYVQTFGSEPT